MNTRFKYFLRFLLSLALTTAFAVAGAVVGTTLTESTVNTLGFVALGIMGLVAILIIVNLIGSKRYGAKLRNNVRLMQEHLLSRRDEAIRNLPRVVRRMITFRRATTAYTAFILLVAVATAFLVGVGGKYGLAIFPVYLFYGFFGRLLPRLQKPDFSDYTKPEDYPTLHAIADRAAEALGEKGEIRIYLTADCNAGIAKIGKVYSLQIGVQLLSILSEEELYQVLLHEFAHLTKESNPADKETRLVNFITERDDSPMSSYLNLLFLLPDTVYVLEYVVYRMTSSAVIETLADRAIVKQGNPQVAASSLAKIAFYSLFERELDDFIEDHIFAPETPRRDAITIKINAFRKALEKRESFWRRILANEIQPRSASHPILRTRLENLGVSEYTVTLPNDTGIYREECDKAIAHIDKLIFESFSEDYEKKRENEYLRPLRIVEEWQQRETPLAAEDSRNVIDALRALGRNEELEALCDEIIQNTENVFATPHALMAKGVCLLKRYDKEGIDYIYRAMEINHNYVEGGLEQIGEFCCLMGLEKELEEYREKAVELQQENNDSFSKSANLTARDHLVADTMPREMLDSILAYIRSIDHEDDVDTVFLVRKIVNDHYFTSVFVVNFKIGTEPETIDTIMDALFNHLDTRPEDWHFSLFLYDSVTAPAVNKVKNSCVYTGKTE